MGHKKRGLIKIFILIVIGVIVLAALGIDVQGFFQKPLVKKIVDTLWQVGNTTWTFLEPYLHTVWDFVLQYIWTPVTNRLDLGNKAATSTSVSL